MEMFKCVYIYSNILWANYRMLEVTAFCAGILAEKVTSLSQYSRFAGVFILFLFLFYFFFCRKGEIWPVELVEAQGLKQRLWERRLSSSFFFRCCLHVMDSRVWPGQGTNHESLACPAGMLSIQPHLPSTLTVTMEAIGQFS